jgi:hypothetical protein
MHSTALRVVSDARVTLLQDTCSDLGAVGATAKAEVALSDMPHLPFFTSELPAAITSKLACTLPFPRDLGRRAASMMNGASAPTLVIVTGGHYRHTRGLLPAM